MSVSQRGTKRKIYLHLQDLCPCTLKRESVGDTKARWAPRDLASGQVDFIRTYSSGDYSGSFSKRDFQKGRRANFCCTFYTVYRRMSADIHISRS